MIMANSIDIILQMLKQLDEKVDKLMSNGCSKATMHDAIERNQAELFQKLNSLEVSRASAAAADVSSISGLGVTLKGPVTRLAIAGIVIIAAVWVIVNRNNTAMQKDMTEKIIPALIQSMKTQSTLSQTQQKGDTP